MVYSSEQINQMANQRMRRLLNNEYKVENLPNTADLYSQGKEVRDSNAIRNTNPTSRLFLATFED